MLLAWDPVQQREAWRVNYRAPGNGGIVDGRQLVFQGSVDGIFNAYAADTGARLVVAAMCRTPFSAAR